MIENSSTNDSTIPPPIGIPITGTHMAAFGLIGGAALILQVILLRELLATFGGTELVIGATLSAWLVLGAAGIGIRGIIRKFTDNTAGLLPPMLILTTVLSLAALLLSRGLLRMFGLLPGEVPSIIIMLLGSVIVLLPVAAPLALALAIAAAASANPKRDVPRLVLAEAVGAGVAGLLLLVPYIRTLGAFRLTFLASAALIVAAALWVQSKNRSRKPVFVAASVSGIILLGILCNFPMHKLEIVTQGWRFAGETVIAAEDTSYGSAVVTEREGRRLLFMNGHQVGTSEPGREAAEIIFIPLLSRIECPRKILIIGGALSGIVDLAARLNASVTVLEPDCRLFALGKKYLRGGKPFPKNVQVEFVDPIRFVAQTEKEFDYILINPGEPVSAGTARLLTKDFLGSLPLLECNATAALHLPYRSNLTQWPEDVVEIIKSARIALNKSTGFPGVYAVESSGVFLIWETQMFGSRWGKKPAQLAGEIAPHMTSEFYKQVETGPRRVYLNISLGDFFSGKESSVFHPLSLRAALRHRAAATGSGTGLFEIISNIGLWHVILALAVIGIIWPLLGRHWRPAPACGAIFSIAFFGMVLEITLMMVFYAVAGTLYLSIGLLLAAFMIGYAIGCRYTGSLTESGKVKKWLITILLISISVTLMLGLLGKPLLASRIAPTIVYFTILLVIGGIVGAAYPLAHAAVLATSGEPQKYAATAYAFDLLGAAFGGLVAGFVLMPLFGFTYTCVLVCVVLAGGLLAACFIRK